MKAKTYLRGLWRLNLLILQKADELEALRSASVSTTAPMSGERGGRRAGDKIGSLVPRIIALEDEIDAELLRYLEEKHTMINMIQSLENPAHIAILYKRYVEFKKLEEIAEELHYEYQYTRRLHGVALQAFEKSYKM